MKRIIVNVSDEKFDDFMKIIESQGLNIVEEDFEIPEWHKEIVRERIKNTKEEDFIPWEQVRKDLGI
ncbi:MAG TPA: hypothetical protein VK826_12775 [Bacteroidia bacterium]|nr:hypothetical protein [Bacteroidia bacterium]